MNLPIINRLWWSHGTVSVDEALAPDEAFGRLAHFFEEGESAFDEDGTTLAYRKANPAAQHRLATFSSGILHYAQREHRTEIAYRVRSPALLLTFLAPLLFFALGQSIVGIGMLNESMSAEESEEEEKKEPGELHWIDQMLGAPAPEAPDEGEDGEDKEDEEDEDHSPMPAYGLAGIFALIYLVGRVLEPRLFKANLRKALSGEEQIAGDEAGDWKAAQ